MKYAYFMRDTDEIQAKDGSNNLVQKSFREKREGVGDKGTIHVG